MDSHSSAAAFVGRTDVTLEDAHTELRRAHRLELLLDYDGTLVPLRRVPALASPDEELLVLLHALARRPQTHVAIVSGRGRATMQEWFGDMPIALWAEHGFWHRRIGAPWHAQAALLDLKRAARCVAALCCSVEGSWCETKESCLAWHTRGVELSASARCTAVRLLDRAAPLGAQVVVANQVVEVRPRTVHKGLAAPATVATGDACFAAGDDTTDLDLFAALPAGALRATVGAQIGAGDVTFESPAALRSFLARLL